MKTSLPDTFAGGRFNLPLKAAKIVRLAESGNDNERAVCNTKLEPHGYFVDRVGICWPLNNVPDFAKDRVK